MARIRTIKPDFFTSEDIVLLSPLARILFIATWCEADREGRLRWRPLTLKMRYLPADNCDIDELCDELIRRKVIVLYEVRGETFAHIPSFLKHQIINNRESKTTLPPPPAVDDACGTRGDRDNDAKVTPLVGNGREGKGRERKESNTDRPKEGLEREAGPSEGDEGDTVETVARALQRVSTTPLSLKTVQDDIEGGLREGVTLSQYRELATTLRSLPVESTDAISVTRAIRQLRPVAPQSTSTAPAFALDPPATAAEKATVRQWMADSHGSVEAWLKASKALAEEGLPDSHGKFGADAWVNPLVALLRRRPNTDHWRQMADQKAMAS
ncbi:hypothetical protein [Azospirillum sp.]|uniref:hypothetical protein n=1 Tax=Azospirillum sp. TaxID=34012 RepID=UPI003D71764C